MRRRGLVVTVVVTCSLLLGLSGLFAGATSLHCDAPRPTLLSLQEMGGVKKRVDAHARRPETPLVLDGGEASFLLADYFELPVTLDVNDGSIEAIVARRTALGRCLNVSFRGSVVVDAGTATMVPEAVSVGLFDLSWIVAGKEWTILPSSIRNERAGRLLALTRSLAIDVDQLVVHLDDPWSLR